MKQRFVAFARPYVPLYLVGLLLLLVTNGLGLWIPWLLRDAVQAVESGQELAVVARLALMMIGVALAVGVVRTFSRLAMLGNSRKIVYDVRIAFFAHLQRLGCELLRHDTAPATSCPAASTTSRLIQGFFGPGLMNLLNTAIVYVAVLVLLLRIDPRLTLISLTLFPVLMFLVNRLSRRVYSISIAVQEQLGEISSRAQENISGIQQVKTFVQEEREIDGFRDLCAEYRRRNLSMAALRGGMLSLIGIVTGVGNADRALRRRQLRDRGPDHLRRLRRLQRLPRHARLADDRPGLDHQHVPARRRGDEAARRGALAEPDVPPRWATTTTDVRAGRRATSRFAV